jgi:serine/threonine protein kinase
MTAGETAQHPYPVQPGDVLAGKYTVERVLGVGGMGVVVAARHIHLDEHVAIKFMLPEIAAKGGELVARFMREGRAAVKIRSEHVARVTDVGLLDNGAPYMVMEYLQGRDLQQVLDSDGPVATEHAVDFVLQASEAIAEAHSLGIVHRDLKPANLFLAHRADGSSCVKVLDFGISKMARTGESGVTRTQATMGSPLYMSPEQVMSAGNVDARADIWSLGVILFQLVTGKVPFDGDTIAQVVFKVVQSPARPIRELVPDVHPALEAAVMRCLEKERGARFQSVGELAVALAPAAPERSQLSVQRIARLLGTTGSGPIPRPPVFSSSPPALGLTPVPVGTPSVAPPMQRTGLVILAVLLVLGVAAGIVALVWMKNARTHAGATPDTTATATATATSAPVVAAAPSSVVLAPEPTAQAPSSAPAASAPKVRGLLPPALLHSAAGPATPTPTPTATATATATASARHPTTVVPDDRQ